GRIALPVERSRPALHAHRVPAFREPELGAEIAILIKKGEVFRACDEPRTKTEGRQIDRMAGRLVVEGKALDRIRIWCDADANESRRWRREAQPLERRGNGLRRWLKGTLAIGRTQRICEKSILDVGGSEFEVLLLVLETEGDAAQRLILCALLQQPRNAGVDVLTVGEYLLQRRPREAGAQPFLRHVAKRLVVAVEQPPEVRMKRLVRRYELTENEGFEKPRRVRKMPFDRRGFRTRLHHHVLRRERSAELHGSRADSTKTGEQGWGGRLLDQHG